MSSSAIRSSMRNSPLSSMNVVRRSSEYFSRTAISSLHDDAPSAALRSRGSRAAARSVFISSASSSRIFWRSRPVRRCSCMSRIACDWSCESPNCVIRPSRASAGFFDPRMSVITRVEVVERDACSPSRMCARASALRSSNSVRRRTTSRRNSMKCSRMSTQRQHARPAADDRQHDDAERRLQLRVLVEVVEDHLGLLAALQLDDDPHAVAVRLVAQIGDALDRLLAHAAPRCSRAAASC